MFRETRDGAKGRGGGGGGGGAVSENFFNSGTQLCNTNL